MGEESGAGGGFRCRGAMQPQASEPAPRSRRASVEMKPHSHRSNIFLDNQEEKLHELNVRQPRSLTLTPRPGRRLPALGRGKSDGGIERGAGDDFWGLAPLGREGCYIRNIHTRRGASANSRV